MKIRTSGVLLVAALFGLVAVTYGYDGDSAAGDPEKRRGWGKRAEIQNFADDEADDFVKRRGWGKRALPAATDPVDEGGLGGDPEKRRGWGKRSRTDDLAAVQQAEEKRRGWGKRSGQAELDERVEALAKRRGWGKRTSPLGQPEKRRGWGKRSKVTELLEDLRKKDLNRLNTGRRSDVQSCDDLRDEVFSYVYKAVEAESKRIEQCEV